MGKKLNKTEIETIAKTILQQVNEVNKVYNETIKTTPAYIAEISKIESKNPLIKITGELEKQVTIALGSNWKDDLKLSLYASEANNKYDKILKEIKKEKEEYIKSVSKIIYYIPYDSWSKQNNTIFQSIVDEITLAQITTTDIQLLINTIKAKLV